MIIHPMQNETYMYSSIFLPNQGINPTDFEIIFSFLLTILIIYMISNTILPFIKEEELE